MTLRKPVVVNAGKLQQLQGGDTLAGVVASGYPAPSAPTGLTVGDQGQISGLSGSGVYHFKVYTSATGTGGWANCYDSASASGDATGLSVGAQYFAATATTSDGAEGPYGTVASHTIAVPAAVTGLAPTAGNGQVSLAWSAGVSGCTYNTYYSTTSSSGPWTLAHSGLSSNSDTITGLSNGTLYYFTVEQVRNGFTSAKCTAVSATPSSQYFHKLQSTSQEFASSSSARTLQYGSNVTAGTLLVVGIKFYNNTNPGTVTVSDSSNGSWTQAGSYADNSNIGTTYRTAIFYVKNTVSGVKPTVTVTPSATATVTFAIYEFDGNAASSILNDYQKTTGGAATQFWTTPSCACQTNGLLFSVYGATGGSGLSTTTVGSGLTLGEVQGANPQEPICTAYHLTPSGAQTVQWDNHGAQYGIASVASFNHA